MRLRWKIMLPYALLTLVFAVLAGYSMTRLVISPLEDRVNSQLAEASRVVADAVVRDERQHLTDLRTITFTDGVVDAVAANDSRALADIVGPVVANARAARVDILDSTGRPLFAEKLADSSGTGYVAITDPDDYASWPVVRDVIEGREDGLGDKWTGVQTVAGTPFLLSSGPLRDNDGALVGVVIVGTPLDAVLSNAKGAATADVTIFDQAGQPLGSTFPAWQDDTTTLLEDPEPNETASAHLEQKTLVGREYEFLYADLRVRNELVGRYAVAVSVTALTNAAGRARWETSIVFGALTASSLLIGWLLSRHLTRPLSRLVGVAKAVAHGDLSARANLASADEIGTLAATFDAMTERLQRQHVATIGALASAIDARDPSTAGHSVRVGELSVALGTELGLPSASLYHLQIGGILHDIGKIGIRDSILLKPGRLTARERAAIQEHPRIGLTILASADLPAEVLAIVGGHHERLNGSGYPLNLTEADLSIFPRIAAVADVFDAVTTDRPYRTAMETEEALRLLRKEAAAGLLDPDVVAAMLKLADWWDSHRTQPVAAGSATPARAAVA